MTPVKISPVSRPRRGADRHLFPEMDGRNDRTCPSPSDATEPSFRARPMMTPEQAIAYENGPVDPVEYAELFDSTGWNDLYRCTPQELAATLEASWVRVCARDGTSLIGSGRVVSDGVLYGVVFDMVVAPKYRGRGIGTEILRRLLARCETAGLRDVLLFSARGTSDFYARFGFVPRPADAPGMILRRTRGRSPIDGSGSD